MSSVFLTPNIQNTIVNYIRTSLEPIILYGIIELNARYEKDSDPVTGHLYNLYRPKLIMSGGEVLNKYFSHIPETVTPDFDIKLTIPYDKPIDSGVSAMMKQAQNDAIDYFAKLINQYIVLSNLNNYLNQDFEVRLATSPLGYVRINNIGPYLANISYTFVDNHGNSYLFPLVDLYRVEPEGILDFNLFTPKGSKILSDSNVNPKGDTYFIPYSIVNGVPYAGLGYVIYDTVRLINILPKQVPMTQRIQRKIQKYITKYQAVINALDTPVESMACLAMRPYVEKCNLEFSNCTTNVDQLIAKAVSYGILPNNQIFINNLRTTLGDQYLCEYINTKWELNSGDTTKAPKKSVMVVET